MAELLNIFDYFLVKSFISFIFFYIFLLIIVVWLWIINESTSFVNDLRKFGEIYLTAYIELTKETLTAKEKFFFRNYMTIIYIYLGWWANLVNLNSLKNKLKFDIYVICFKEISKFYLIKTYSFIQLIFCKIIYFVIFDEKIEYYKQEAKKKSIWTEIKLTIKIVNSIQSISYTHKLYLCLYNILLLLVKKLTYFIINILKLIISNCKKLYNFIYKIIKFFIFIFINTWKFGLLAFILVVAYLFNIIVYSNVSLFKQLSIWYIILIIFILIVITFIDFLSKYKYGKYNTATQRFWKRTSIIFWLLEIFLFILFYYYYINSSQEPTYMFDFNNFNQEMMLQINCIAQNSLILLIAVFLVLILLYNLNTYTYKQNIVITLIITLFLFYTLCNESYQFYYIITSFNEKLWALNDVSNTWILEESKINLRVKQQYFAICLLAKYWHFIFIFVNWFIFLINTLKYGKITLTLLSYNFQNLIILYILNISCLIQLLKFFFKNYIELYYDWFFYNFNSDIISIFFNELFSFYINIFYLNDIFTFYTYLFNIYNVYLNNDIYFII